MLAIMEHGESEPTTTFDGKFASAFSLTWKRWLLVGGIKKVCLGTNNDFPLVAFCNLRFSVISTLMLVGRKRGTGTVFASIVGIGDTDDFVGLRNILVKLRILVNKSGRLLKHGSSVH